ncbi:MAG: hypothetical protein ACLUVZ_16015 [Bacteroides stercoris]
MNAPDDKALPERTVSIAEAVHIVTGKEMGTVWEQVEAIVHKYAWSDCTPNVRYSARSLPYWRTNFATRLRGR